MNKLFSKFTNKKLWFPVFIFLAGSVIVIALLSSPPKIKPKPKSAKLPGVEVITLKSEQTRIPVHTRGNVNPAIQIQLTSEVNGSVIAVSPKFSNGSYFKKGDWLVKVDRSQYEMEVERAQAKAASARLNLLKTRANIKSGNIEGINVGRRSELAKGVPQLKEAEGNYNATVSAVKLARRQLEKTTITAPFDGRVLKKAIDIKEYVAIGKPVAQLYSIDKAEVRLPLSTAQHELVDIPLRYASESTNENQPPVILEDSSGKYHWKGRIIRSEGNVDPRNRLNYVIAQIDSPYAPDPLQPDRPPLSAGTFVSATIQGKTHEKLISLPLDALHNMDEVRLLNSENRVHVQKVDILYRDKDRAFISSGVRDGDKVVLTPLEVVVENMEVVVLSEAEPMKPLISEDIFAIKSPEKNTSTSAKNDPQKKQENSKTTKPTKPPISPAGMAGMMAEEQETDI